MSVSLVDFLEAFVEHRIVKKANTLIEASYKLSTVEQKIIMFLASTIKPEDEEFKSYPIKIKEFQNFLGNSSCNYDRIEKVILRLKEKNLKIIFFNEEGKKAILNVNWLSSTLYVDGSGVINLRFDPSLTPFFLQLKRSYTKYRLKNIVQLKSQFSIRLYELLKQYEKIGQRSFSVAELRSTLGIAESQYRQYTDFRKRVLLVAQGELTEKTDVSFKFEEIRSGHGVRQIRFLIESKPHAKTQLNEAELISVIPSSIENKAVDSDLQKVIALLPLEFRGKESISKLLCEYLAKHGLDFVARNIEYSNVGSNAVNPGVSHGKGSNYRNYLAKALKGDFGLAFQEDHAARQAKEEKAREEKAAAEAALQQTQEKARRDQEDMDRARVYQDSLAPEALAHLRAEAFSRLDSRQQDLVRRKGPGSELTLKLMMTRISLERMKISSPSPSLNSQETS